MSQTKWSFNRPASFAAAEATTACRRAPSRPPGRRDKGPQTILYSRGVARQRHQQLLLAALSILTALGAGTSELWAQADASAYYIRSQHRDGTFLGYQEILKQTHPGYIRVNYCDQTYFVRPSTVLWTETEAVAGRLLAVEANTNDEREIICQAPQLQVRLEDLGMKKSELDALRARESPANTRPSRMRVIRDAFKGFK